MQCLVRFLESMVFWSLRLDPAIIRPGRVDYIQEIGHATSHQLEQMYLRFYPELDPELAIKFAEKVLERHRPVSVASVQGFFMIHKSNGLGVFDHLDNLWRWHLKPLYQTSFQMLPGPPLVDQMVNAWQTRWSTLCGQDGQPFADRMVNPWWTSWPTIGGPYSQLDGQPLANVMYKYPGRLNDGAEV